MNNTDVNKLPEGFNSLAEAQQQKFLALKKIKDDGGKVVGTYCTYVPSDVIYAAGAVPVSLCATSEAQIKSAEKDLPTNLCPLIKASYGHAITDTCPFFYYSDIIIGETTCDGKKKMFELMNDVKETYVLQLPQVNNEKAVKYWMEEIEDFRKKLEEFYGVTITDEDIKKAIKKGNEERRNLIEFYKLSMLNPSPITGLEQFNVTEAFGFTYDRKKKNEELVNRTRELKEYWDKNLKGTIDNRPRILMSGCPMGGVKEKIIKTIEDLGASIVAFDSCSGLRDKMDFVDETMENPIEAIARKTLNTHCSVMTPNDGRLKDIEYLIKEYNIDAVIEVTLTACHTFNIESKNVNEFVTKEKNLPYIHIESDYSQNDKGQLTTRLEAFLEMVAQKKK